MKRILHTTLITTILLSLLFVSCNADASAGLFRQLVDAKAPVGITYRQIIGLNAGNDTLYFLTIDGIYQTDGTTSTQVRANEKLKPIYNAYVDGTTLVYVANTLSGAEVGQYNLTSGVDTTQPHPTNAGYSEYVIKGVYANKLFLLEGKDTSNNNQFSLATYDATNNKLTDTVTIDASANGIKFHSVLQMSGLQQEDISTTHPMILSFVKADKKTYQHFYTDGTALTPWELTLDENRSLAAFTIVSGNLYVITEDGHLYGSLIPTTDTILNSMVKLSRQYAPNAFVHSTSVGGKTYLVTKTNTATEAFYVISFADDLVNNTGAVDGNSIASGYAKHMANVTIVDAFKKPLGDILIATHKNGIFDLSIPVNPTSGGTSKGPEDYTLL